MNFIVKKYLILILTFSLLNFNILFSDERVDAVIDQIQIISKDLKTLEKAFYTKIQTLLTKPKHQTLIT